jgi:hypothetical protein
VLRYFPDYIRHGYYPFYNELPELYASRLNEIINLIIEAELPQLRGIEMAYIHKIKQLLYVISESAPFIPNISKLSERIGITRNSLLAYLHALHESKLTMNMQKESHGISRLQKPDKVFMENTNLMYAVADMQVNKGNLRETFFANQLRYRHRVNISDRGDFLVDEKYTFEIGGHNKDSRQISDLTDAYIAADDIEYGFGNKIPLWLFGFLY